MAKILWRMYQFPRTGHLDHLTLTGSSSFAVGTIHDTGFFSNLTALVPPCYLKQLQQSTCQRSLWTSMTSLDGSDLGTMRYFLWRFRLGGVATESTDMRIPLALLSVRSTSLLSFGRGVTSPSFRLKPPPAVLGCYGAQFAAAQRHREWV